MEDYGEVRKRGVPYRSRVEGVVCYTRIQNSFEAIKRYVEAEKSI